MNSYCLLTSDSTYVTLPKEGGTVKQHKSWLQKAGEIAGYATTIAGAAGGIAAVNSNSITGMVDGMKRHGDSRQRKWNSRCSKWPCSCQRTGHCIQRSQLSLHTSSRDEERKTCHQGSEQRVRPHGAIPHCPFHTKEERTANQMDGVQLITPWKIEKRGRSAM